MQEKQGDNGRDSKLPSLEDEKLNRYLLIVALRQRAEKNLLRQPEVEVNDPLFGVSDFSVAGSEIRCIREAQELLVLDPAANPLYPVGAWGFVVLPVERRANLRPSGVREFVDQSAKLIYFGNGMVDRLPPFAPREVRDGL